MPLEFRQESLDHLISSKAHYQLIKITRLSTWIILSSLGLLLLTLVIWGLFGSISSWVEGRGIILPLDCSYHSATLQEGSGELEDYLVRMGETVAAGQTLARLNNQLLQDQIKTHAAYIKKMEDLLAQETRQSQKEISTRAQQAETQKTLLKTSLSYQESFLEFIQDVATKIKRLNDEHAIANSRKEQVAQSVLATQEAIHQLKIQISRLDEELEDFKFKWQDHLKEITQKIDYEEYQQAILINQADAAKAIVAPLAGTIVELSKTKGDLIKKGDSVATISSNVNDLDVIFFINAEEGKKITPGMRAWITPTIVERAEYGGIEASVTYVSPLPVTEERMKAVLQNNDLIKKFISYGPSFIEVRARLEKDSHTYSGYKWSSSRGPSLKIEAGLLANARVEVRRQSPLSLLFFGLHTLEGK